jgi:hypothetical protein
MINVKEDKNAEIHARWLSVIALSLMLVLTGCKTTTPCCYTYANAYSYAYACCHTYANFCSFSYPHTYHDADTSSCQREYLRLRFCAVNVNCVRGNYSYLDQQRFSFPYRNQQ